MTALSPASGTAAVIAHLQTLRNEENIAGMGRFGIVTDTAIGISTDQMRRIARDRERPRPRPRALE